MSRNTTARTVHGIDLRSPDGLERLLAFHRRLHGDARMMANDGGDGSGDTGDEGSGSQGGDGDTDGTEGDASNEGAEQDKSDGLPDDPAALKTMIANLRRENGANRTAAKQKAADDAVADLTKKLGTALGLVKNDDDKGPNADELTQQLTAAQQAQRDTAVELAVYRSASKHDADPVALTDSRAFLAKVANLDPTAADFSTKVDAAIKAAVDSNPKLKATQAVPRGGGQHNGGTPAADQHDPRKLAERIAAQRPY